MTNTAVQDTVARPFSDTPTPALEEFQVAFLTTIHDAAAVLVGSGESAPDNVRALIRTAASLTPAGQALRDLFHTPAVVDPPPDVNRRTPVPL